MITKRIGMVYNNNKRKKNSPLNTPLSQFSYNSAIKKIYCTCTHNNTIRSARCKVQTSHFINLFIIYRFASINVVIRAISLFAKYKFYLQKKVNFRLQ